MSVSTDPSINILSTLTEPFALPCTSLMLPISFANTWMTNIERNPERTLRNANDLFIPPHRVEFVKRLPLYTLPLAWNNAPGDKLNPRQHLYLKELKSVLLSSI